MLINFNCYMQSAQVIIAKDMILLWIFLIKFTRMSSFYIV
jgi:hypothetical protein